MGFSLKNILRTVGAAIDPTPGDLLSTAILGRVSGETGVAEEVVDKVINAFREDPEVSKLRIEAEQKLAELQAEYLRVAGENLAALDARSADDPTFVKLVRGSVRPLAVGASVGVMVVLALGVGLKALFSLGTWTPENLEAIEVIFTQMKWLVGTLTAAYFAARSADKRR